MQVFSPLSLYTTHISWQIYDLIFEAMHSLGLWALGILFIASRFIRNLVTSSGEGSHSSRHALNVCSVELLIYMITCMVFVYPSVHLSTQHNTFRPICHSENVQDSKIADTGTTYDDDFTGLVSDEVSIPVGFDVIESLASAATYSLMKTVSCTDGINSIKSDLISTHIPAKLNQEIQNFKGQCFLPAKMKFKRGDPAESSYSSKLSAYGGNDDLNWVGSHVLRDLYYKDMKSQTSVKRYKYSQYPSKNFEQFNNEEEKSMLPDYGFPDCESWWKDIRTDLKDLIDDKKFTNKNAATRGIYLRILKILNGRNVLEKNRAESEELAQDLIARTLIENTGDIFQKDDSFYTANGKFSEVVSGGVLRVGQAFNSWVSTPLKREAVRETIPVMLALASFFITVFMPVIVIISGCTLQSIGQFCGLKVMLIFMNFATFLVTWLENSIVDSISGNGQLVSIIHIVMVSFYAIACVILLKLSATWGAASGAGILGIMPEFTKATDQNVNAGVSAVKAGAGLASRGIKVAGALK